MEQESASGQKPDKVQASKGTAFKSRDKNTGMKKELRDLKARTFLNEQLPGSNLPGKAQERVRESVLAHDGDVTEDVVRKHILREQQYLSEIQGEVPRNATPDKFDLGLHWLMYNYYRLAPPRRRLHHRLRSYRHIKPEPAGR